MVAWQKLGQSSFTEICSECSVNLHLLQIFTSNKLSMCNVVSNHMLELDSILSQSGIELIFGKLKQSSWFHLRSTILSLLKLHRRTSSQNKSKSKSLLELWTQTLDWTWIVTQMIVSEHQQYPGETSRITHFSADPDQITPTQQNMKF